MTSSPSPQTASLVERLDKHAEASYWSQSCVDSSLRPLVREAASTITSLGEQLLNNALIHDEEVKDIRSTITRLEQVLRDMRAGYHNEHGPHDGTKALLEHCTYSLCNEPRVRTLLPQTPNPQTGGEAVNVPKVATAPNAPTVAQLAERHIIENEELRAENASLTARLSQVEQERDTANRDSTTMEWERNDARERISLLEKALGPFVERSPTMIGDRDCGDSACIGCGSYANREEADAIEHDADCMWIAARAALASQTPNPQTGER